MKYSDLQNDLTNTLIGLLVRLEILHCSDLPLGRKKPPSPHYVALKDKLDLEQSQTSKYFDFV